MICCVLLTEQCVDTSPEKTAILLLRLPGINDYYSVQTFVKLCFFVFLIGIGVADTSAKASLNTEINVYEDKSFILISKEFTFSINITQT